MKTIYPTEVANHAGWFCVRTKPRHEHIAAAGLRRNLALEVCLPRVRFNRPTRHGQSLVTEALFPNYLFARFDQAMYLRRVQAAPGVTGIVHFGHHWPTISDGIIAELRAAMGNEELRMITNEFNPGDVVEIATGVFHGLQAVVTRIMPGKQRVAVLLDFLGRQTTIELAGAQLVPTA
ncbi:MAG: transcription termination/antitermination NusG family protein [Verrucomicrobiota bacterium]